MTRSNSVISIIKTTIKRKKGLSLGLFISVIALVVLSLIPPQILRRIIDDSLNKKNMEPLVFLSCFYFITLLLIGLLDFVKEALLTIYGQNITKQIRMELLKKVAKIPAGYFSNHESGMVVSYFNNDVEAIQSLFTNGVVSMAIDGMKILGILVSIFLFSAYLGTMVLFLIPIIYAITRYFQKKMKVAQLENRGLLARVNNHIPESIRNLPMIHSFCKESYMEEIYKKYLERHFYSKETVNFYDSIYSPIILVIKAIIIALIVILSAGKVSILGLSVGTVAAAIALISNLFSPIQSLGMELQSIQMAMAGILRVDTFFMEEEACTKLDSIQVNDMIKQGVTLCFHQVSFGYQTNQPLLKRVSFTIQENEKVTFVGRTGTGKSTLFKLILGLLEADEGSITIGGVDVRKIPNKEKRKIFGYVEQTFHFIRGTIVEQIRLYDTSIALETVEEAMKFVGLHEYILHLSKQYDTIATEHLFSQGQRQLLSIARAIVLKPPILLLDEMTANLDADTEQMILTVLQSVAKGRMLLSISHRQSTCLDENRILYLKDKKLNQIR